VLVTVPTLKELRLHRVTGSAPVWQVLQHFTSLQLLHIVECSTLCTLPEGIQHLTSLQQLELVECDALTLLPEGIGQLSALRSLRIYECSALESLPLSIKRLTALQTLYVFGCRGLTKRYEEEVGDDWHLISHIPDVTVVDMELLAHRAYYASVTS
jgi:hypothetical protein